jgi:DNA-3-methyladenine glycosylase II
MVSSSPIPFPGGTGKEKPKARPAEPHTTNALLETPGGSRVAAYSSSPVKSVPFLLNGKPETETEMEAEAEAEANGEKVSTPKKTKRAKKIPVATGPPLGVPPPTSTTETLLHDACAHLLKVDPKLKAVIDKHHCKMFSPEGLMEPVEPFQALASGIIGQQVCLHVLISISFLSTIPIYKHTI